MLVPSAGGLDHLATKIDQLVGRGFHNIVVSLEGTGGGGASALDQLVRSKEVIDTWAGSLRVCDLTSGEEALRGRGVDVFGSREEAIDAYRAAMGADVLDPGQSGDLLESGDRTSEENDWGWGTQEETEDEVASGPPIADLFVDDDDLPKLERELRKVVAGGKKHVSLRLHFDRPMREEDVTVLTACRHLLAREGGQLALVALPHDALKWLRMLDFDREFLIVETADEAEEAHRRQAGGEAPLPPGKSPAKAAAAPAQAAAPFAVVSQDGDAYVIRPREKVGAPSVRRTNREVPLLDPAQDLSGLPERVRGLAVGALVDLGRLRDASQSQALRPLAAASRLAGDHGLVVACANVSHEVGALLPALGVSLPTGRDLPTGVLALAGGLHRREPFDELRLVLQRETLAGTAAPILELGDIMAAPVGPGGDVSSGDRVSSAEVEALRVQYAKAEGEAQRLGEELRGAQARLERTQHERDEAQTTLTELQNTLRRSERRVNELEQAQVLAERRAQQAQSGAEQAQQDTRRLDGELARLRQELDEAQAQLEGAREAAAEGGQAIARVQELEGQLQREQAQVKEIQGKLEAAGAERKRLEQGRADLERQANNQVQLLKTQLEALQRAQAEGDVAKLQRQVVSLEEEKARILTEAETEIERLTREQRLLREELESAGEMIERLGKELELS
ncbi:MAG: hypothetical protein AB7N76_05010 [Planctomycetota bacterium]